MYKRQGQDLLDHKILSKEEEFELIRRAQSPIDPKRAKAARDRLLLCNMKFIYSYCKKWCNDSKGVTADELLCDGILAFLNAIQKFDATKGLRLCTYAGIAVNRALSGSTLLDPVINLPSYQDVNLYKVNNAISELKAKGIVNPTEEQIAECTDISLESVKFLRDYTGDDSIVSIDTELSVDNGNVLIAEIIDDPDANKENEIEVEIDASYFLGLLPPLHRVILSRYYGIPVKLTLEQMGQLTGTTKERIRQIKKDALCALQIHAMQLQSADLKEYAIASKRRDVLHLLTITNIPRFLDGLYIDESDALQPFKKKASIGKPNVPTVKQVDEIKEETYQLPSPVNEKKPLPNPFKDTNSNGNGNGNGNGHKSKEADLVEVPFLVNGSTVYAKRNGNGNHNGNGYRQPKTKRLNTPFGQVTVSSNKELEPSRKQKARQKSALRRQRRKGIDNNYTKSTISKEEVQLQLFDM